MILTYNGLVFDQAEEFPPLDASGFKDEDIALLVDLFGSVTGTYPRFKQHNWRLDFNLASSMYVMFAFSVFLELVKARIPDGDLQKFSEFRWSGRAISRLSQDFADKMGELQDERERIDYRVFKGSIHDMDSDFVIRNARRVELRVYNPILATIRTNLRNAERNNRNFCNIYRNGDICYIFPLCERLRSIRVGTPFIRDRSGREQNDPLIQCFNKHMNKLISEILAITGDIKALGQEHMGRLTTNESYELNNVFYPDYFRDHGIHRMIEGFFENPHLLTMR
jgi:hypothetical protein